MLHALGDQRRIPPRRGEQCDSGRQQSGHPCLMFAVFCVTVVVVCECGVIVSQALSFGEPYGIMKSNDPRGMAHLAGRGQQPGGTSLSVTGDLHSASDHRPRVISAQRGSLPHCDERLICGIGRFSTPRFRNRRVLLSGVEHQFCSDRARRPRVVFVQLREQLTEPFPGGEIRDRWVVLG